MGSSCDERRWRRRFADDVERPHPAPVRSAAAGRARTGASSGPPAPASGPRPGMASPRPAGRPRAGPAPGRRRPRSRRPGRRSCPSPPRACRSAAAYGPRSPAAGRSASARGPGSGASRSRASEPSRRFDRMPQVGPDPEPASTRTRGSIHPPRCVGARAAERPGGRSPAPGDCPDATGEEPDQARLVSSWRVPSPACVRSSSPPGRRAASRVAYHSVSGRRSAAAP